MQRFTIFDVPIIFVLMLLSIFFSIGIPLFPSQIKLMIWKSNATPHDVFTRMFTIAEVLPLFFPLQNCPARLPHKDYTRPKGLLETAPRKAKRSSKGYCLQGILVPKNIRVSKCNLISGHFHRPVVFFNKKN